MTDAAFQLLPDLASDDYERLRSDIAERGVLIPIEVDEDGRILDGHHRRRAADELGVDCPQVVRTGMAEHEKRLHAVALNLARRHLTQDQKIALGRRIEPDVAERARQRMLAGTADPKDKCPEGQTRDEVAHTVGLGSGRTYERGRKRHELIRAKAPELMASVESGELSSKDAMRTLRQLSKQEHVAEIASRPVAALPADRTYPVLYCDPPWRYEHAPDSTRQVENHYPTMSLDDLAAVRVPAADDCVIFLWATSPKLDEALDLLRWWRFDYRTCAVWVKDRIGMGYYLRQRHELLLVAKRGDLPVPDPSDRPDSVIEAARREHSVKPDAVYELIERMYPRYAKCELFQRRPRDGWAGWGNEVSA